MTPHLNKLLLLLLFPLMAVECREETIAPIDQLPEATKTGAYTIGALINGDAVKNNSSIDILSTYQRGFLAIRGTLDKGDFNNYIEIVLNSAPMEGSTYTLTEYPQDFVRLVILNKSLNINCHYKGEDILEGSVTLTRWDYEKQIVSGTFSFTTVTEGCEQVEVTEGRFDTQFTR